MTTASIFTLLFATRNYGVGVSPDSVWYFKAAGQILNGDSFDMFLWPPLYPASLALVAGIFDIEILDAARFLNVTLFGITIFLCGILYRRFLNSSLILVLLGIATVFVSAALIQVFLWAWSEPLFILFVTLYLLLFDKYTSHRRITYLLFAAVSVALCCMTRYAGIAFVLIGIVNILFLKRIPERKKSIELFLFSAASAGPIMIWLIRNYLVYNTLTGSSGISPYTMRQNLQATITTMLGWYLPKLNWIWIAVVLVFIGIGLGFFIKFNKKNGKPFLSTFFPLLTSIVIYPILLVAISTHAFNGLVDNRYLSPVFIPTNLFLICTLLSLGSIWQEKVGKTVTQLFLIFLVSLLNVVPFTKSFQAIEVQIEEGRGYTSRLWRESETLDYYFKMSDCNIFSNGTDVIEFAAHAEIQALPRKKYWATTIATIDSLKSTWPVEKHICVLWFDDIPRDYYFTPAELKQFMLLEKEVRFSDGVVYYLSRQ